MRISAVTIVNHSRIPNLAVDIRQHAVIVGANDVGKSSILRLLNLTLGASTGALYQRLSKGDLRDSVTPMIDSDGLVGHRLSTSVSTTGTAVGSSVDEI